MSNEFFNNFYKQSSQQATPNGNTINTNSNSSSSYNTPNLAPNYNNNINNEAFTLKYIQKKPTTEAMSPLILNKESSSSLSQFKQIEKRQTYKKKYTMTSVNNYSISEEDENLNFPKRDSFSQKKSNNYIDSYNNSAKMNNNKYPENNNNNNNLSDFKLDEYSKESSDQDKESEQDSFDKEKDPNNDDNVNKISNSTTNKNSVIINKDIDDDFIPIDEKSEEDKEITIKENNRFLKENRKMIIHMIKTLLQLKRYNGLINNICYEYKINEEILNIKSQFNNDCQTSFYDENSKNNFNNDKNNPYNDSTNNQYEEIDETKILCYLSIPRIICRNGSLQLMLISPSLNKNLDGKQKENYLLFFKNVQTFKILEKLQIEYLTSCFRKSVNCFGLQFINKSNFNKITYNIFTKNSEECKKYVEGLNFLLKHKFKI